MKLSQLSTLCLYLRVSCWLVVVAYVFIVLMSYRSVSEVNSSLTDPVIFTGANASAHVLLPDELETGGIEFVDFEVSVNDPWLLLLDFLPPFVFLFLMFRVERLFYSFQQAKFFSKRNNSVLKWIGLSVILLVILQPLQSYIEYKFMRVVVEDVTVYGPGPLHLEVNFPFLIVGLVVYAISFVMDRALMLQDEVKMTV